MGYINQVTGYRNDLLCSRSIIKKGMYALLEPDGLVKSVIPNSQKCEITIFSSPKLGASFVDCLLSVGPEGYNRAGLGGKGIEAFLYLFEEPLKVQSRGEAAVLTKGGYIFCPEGRLPHFENLGEDVRAFLYKRKYVKQESCQTHTVIVNINGVDWTEYEDMADVRMKDSLPVKDDPGFDMNFHIFSFKSGVSHGRAETHVQERGVYIYSEQGIYLSNHDWIPVRKGNYLFMDAHCSQATYRMGRNEGFAYIYSKDCNRDAFL